MKKTKILLIYPPDHNQVDSQTPNFAHQELVIYPPLGLLYLAGMFRGDPTVDIKVVDCQVDFKGFDDLARLIKAENPDIVGVTLISNMLFDAYEILKVVKKTAPFARLVVGGPHVTLYPEIVASSDLVDFAIFGDGEYGFKQLVDVLKEGSFPSKDLLAKVPGLTYKDENKKIVKIPNHLHDATDLDQIPFPDRTLVDPAVYGNPGNKSQTAATIITSRGCPYKCNFCDIPHKKYNFRTAANVADEIEEILSLGINEINVMDDTFNLRRQRIVDICNEIIDRKLKFNWVGRGRVYPFDEELAMLLKKSGCYRFHIGIESGSKEILADIGKKISLKQIRNFFKFCRKAKIDVLAYFILGFPDETEEQIQESIHFSKEIGCKYAYFSILSLFPGTPVYELGKTKNVVQGDPWLEFAKNPVKDFKIPFWTETISRDRLFEILREAYTQFYFSPKYLGQRVIEVLRSPKHTGGMVKAGMAMAKYVVSNKKGF